MKNFILLLSCLFVISGCVSKPNGDYEVIDGVMRSELVQLSLFEQQKTLADVTPEIKTRLWIEKYTDTMLSNKLTEEEKDIIRPWKDYITIECFQKATAGLDDEEYELFKANLEAELMGRLGWDESKFYEYLCTVMTEREWEKTFR